MTTFTVDMTMSSRDLTSHKQLDNLAQRVELLEIVQPGAVVESWEIRGVRYWRFVLTVEAISMRTVMQMFLDQGNRIADEMGISHDDNITVQICIRNLSFPLYDTLPSDARRAMKGGRPPKNP